MNKTKILGMNVDNISINEAVDKFFNVFLKNEKMNIIITPNPEILLKAYYDEEFKNIINSAAMVIPDGIGVVYASKITKNKIKSRVGGLDFTMEVIKGLNEISGSIYILGAKPTVAEKAAENLKKEYPNLNILGTRDGYFKKEDEESIVSEISKLNVDYLILGLGAPRQEKFMYIYKEKLNVKAAIGNGGAIDVMAGIHKRAPKIWQMLGLEWLYRAVIDPSRFPRLIAIPKFIIRVFISKLKGEM